MHEFVHKSLARGCVLHIIDEESVDDEVLALTLHEDSLLIVDSGIPLLGHPP